MRSLPARYRIKTLLAVVAIVAITIGVIQIARRRSNYQSLERSYADLLRNMSASLEDAETQAHSYRELASRPGTPAATAAGCLRFAQTKDAQAAYCRTYVKWYAERREKYRLAASRPWSSVPDDPAAPPEEAARLKAEAQLGLQE